MANGSKVSKGEGSRIWGQRSNGSLSYRGLNSDSEYFGFYSEITGEVIREFLGGELNDLIYVLKGLHWLLCWK